MKKIWFLNHYAIYSNHPGITRHFDFGKELVKRGYEVTIFASNFSHVNKTYINDFQGLYKEEFVEGVRFLWIKTYPSYKDNDWKRFLNMLSYAYEVIKIGLKLEERPNIILGSSLHLFAALSAYILSKRKKAKFVFEVRDLWPQSMVELGSYTRYHPIVWLMYKLEKFLYKRASKIIAVLPKIENYIEDLGIEKSKVIYIPNGVDLEPNDSKSSVLLPDGLEDSINSLKRSGKLIVAYVGSFGVANNVEIILEAAQIIHKSEFQNIHFLLVGDGNRKKKLVEYVEKNNLQNVSFFSAIPKKAVSYLLSKVDITVITWKNRKNLYKYGISANKIFDYMAAAKPVVISINAANNPVEEANCGISIPPENAIELAKALVYLSNMPMEDRIAMGNRGREYVRKHHSIPILVDKLVNAFNS